MKGAVSIRLKGDKQMKKQIVSAAGPVTIKANDEKQRSGQYGFIPESSRRGKHKVRYVESSDVAKGCKLCK